MGRAAHLTSNLDVVKEVCEELEGFFEAFQMDKYWNKNKTKLTVAFTAEKIQPRYMPN
jgi:hypothetical protein